MPDTRRLAHVAERRARRDATCPRRWPPTRRTPPRSSCAPPSAATRPEARASCSCAGRGGRGRGAKAGATLMAVGLHPTRRVRRRASWSTRSATGALGELDARPHPAHPGVRAARARRHAGPGLGDPRPERAARHTCLCCQGLAANSPYWFGVGLGARERALLDRARLSAPRRAACVSRLGRVRGDGRPPSSAAGDFERLHVHLVGRARCIRGSGRSRCARWTRSRPARRRRRAGRAGARRSPPGTRRRRAGRAPAAEAIAESSFRASRDGVERDDPARGPDCSAAREVGPARRVESVRGRARELGSERRARRDRAHPARGRRRGAPARGRWSAAASRRCSTQLVRETQGAPMPELILGPMLRYLDEREATVWVETDAPCEVEVLGRRERTFCVEGHHYAIVPIRGSSRARSIRTRCALDGERRWPRARRPSSRRARSGRSIRTRPLKIVFGSCRVAVPHEPSVTSAKDEDERGPRGRRAATRSRCG